MKNISTIDLGATFGIETTLFFEKSEGENAFKERCIFEASPK